MQRLRRSQTSPPGPTTSIPLSSISPHPPIATLSNPAPIAPLNSNNPNVIPQPNQRPSRPLIAGSSATPTSTSQTTATPMNSASNVTPPSGNSIPHNQVPQNRVLRRKSLGSHAWDMKEFLYAVVMVGLLDGFTLTAPSTNSPLGSITYQNGVLILNIFAIFTGYALSAAAQLVWDKVTYRILLRGKGNGRSLVVFWTLGGQFWVPWLVFWREIRQKSYRIIQPSNRNTNQDSTRAHVKIWSIAKMISWMVMQFPGIVVMTLVNATTSYLPVQWTQIGGGIGVYDPNAAVPGIAPILISTSVTNILQDARRAVQVDPINEECISSVDSCQSFLIPGGLATVSPSPYNMTNSTDLDVFVTKGGPAYQIDFWSPPNDITWTSDECNIYAAGSAAGFQLCASSYPGGPGQIVAGWRPCIGDVLPNGQCDQPYSWKAYRFRSTVLSISRRTATIYSSRSTSTILSWEDLGEPTLQNITTEDFKTAFDVMLLPWSNASSLSFTTSSSVYSLTDLIYVQLAFSLAYPSDIWSTLYLQNLFATPLFIFNPLMIGVTYGGLPAITNIEPGIPAENFIEGSFARSTTHAVPEHWTVITFVAVSGAILFIDFIVLVVTAFYQGPDASDFPFVDSLRFKWIDSSDNGKEVESLKEALDVDIDDNDEVLKRAAELKVKLGNSPTPGVTV